MSHIESAYPASFFSPLLVSRVCVKDGFICSRSAAGPFASPSVASTGFYSLIMNLIIFTCFSNS